MEWYKENLYTAFSIAYPPRIVNRFLPIVLHGKNKLNLVY